MESAEKLKAEKNITELNKTQRKATLEKWLNTRGNLKSFSLQAMPGDASFRHYFRVYTSSNTYVLMDAQAEQKSCQAYVAIAEALRDLGVDTPEMITTDIEQGFLLMTDFGESTYLRVLTAENVSLLYARALDALVLMQNCSKISGHQLPFFTADLMMHEWNGFKEWFLYQLLKLPIPVNEAALNDNYQQLVHSAMMQPQVFMHRDYHSANLMLLPENKVGVLDFQDAFRGPVTYDLVSLLRDCYIDWPEAQVQAWAIDYLHKLAHLGVLSKIEEQQFLRWFDWMGMQRHLKALLTFARKKMRDDQSRYLHFIPRTLNYLIKISQIYPELMALHDYLTSTVQPAFARLDQCEQ